MKMKINQDKSITFNFQSVGYKFEVTPLFFAKFQEVIGLDIKPLLAQWFRSRIESLQKLQELGALTKQDQFDLKNYQAAEQILTSG